ncbi:hypothetical protein [Streptodolium elevatio]
MTKWEPPPRHSAASVYRRSRRIQRFYVPAQAWADQAWADQAGADRAGTGRPGADRAGHPELGGGYVELDVDEWGFVREPPRDRPPAAILATVLLFMWSATLVSAVALGVELAVDGNCADGIDAWWCTELGAHFRRTLPWVAAPVIGAAGTVGVVVGGRLTRRLAVFGWLAGLVALWVVVRLLVDADPAAW